MICADLIAQKLKPYEAGLMLVELRGLIGPEHTAQVKHLIKQLDVPKKEEEELSLEERLASAIRASDKKLISGMQDLDEDFEII